MLLCAVFCVSFLCVVSCDVLEKGAPRNENIKPGRRQNDSLKAESSEKHTKIASGGLLGGSWGALGSQEAPTYFALLPFGPFSAAPGGFREPSGELLGSLWALLARLLALPGLFFGVSGAVAATVGQEA